MVTDALCVNLIPCQNSHHCQPLLYITADHLMVIKFLIDKYVILGGKKLYACFFDIRRAYDTVPRISLMYSLLKNYQIGGNFLKILQEIYTQN